MRTPGGIGTGLGSLTRDNEDWRALIATETSRQPIDMAESVPLAAGIVRPVLGRCCIR